MGLIAFLKAKFGKKKNEEKEIETEVVSNEEPASLAEPEKPVEAAEEPISNKPAKVEIPEPIEKTPAEPAKVEEPKEEIKPAAPSVEPVKPVEPAPAPKSVEPTPKIVASTPKPAAPSPKEKPQENKKPSKADKKKEEEESLESYKKGLEKSRKNFASKLEELSKRYSKVNEEYFEELEQILIESDVGVGLALHLIENLLDWANKNKQSDPKAINEQLVDDMFVDYATKGESIENEIQFAKSGPTVLLVCGVNGVGKTTSIAKLAYRYQKKGKKVCLAAGDTFRAGAVEQLQVWADRLGAPLIKGKVNGDPASVAYDGVKFAKDNNYDLLIVDTAGRLQTKANLMQELGKIYRVLSKEIPEAPHETFLIIDATTGQNGILQAKAFSEVTKVTGIVITKMDGTSKGGILLAIRDELGVPVRFMGLGEKMEDLREFDLDQYLYGLLLGGEES